MAEREIPIDVARKHCPDNDGPVLRPGISDYVRLRRANHAYVDKTRELANLLDSGEFLFLARPRRFGKTLMLSTIECMFQGDRPNVRDPFVEMAHSIPQVPDDLLFAGTSWESSAAKTPRRPVIRLDMSAVAGDSPVEMRISLKQHVAHQGLLWYRRGLDPGIELMHLRDSTSYPHTPQVMLEQLIQSLKSQAGDPVVLVDEYDTPLLKLLGHEPAAVEPFFELFREFYRLFKQCESDLHKVLITGITRRAYGEMFSALNNLRDCTWKEEFGAVCGFTEGDLDQAPLLTYTETAAEGLGMPIDELRERLRENYNGYRFDPDGFGPAVYNPWSLCNALTDLLVPQGRARIQRRGFPAHWSDSGVSKSLVDALRRQPSAVDPTPFLDLDELDADFYSNRATGLKSLMLQSGYLTHHPARDGQPAQLGWPNREVARTVLRDLARTHVGHELPGIERLRTCLATGDYRKLPKVLLDCLYAFPYNIMDDEYSHHAALHGIFLGMGIVPRSERRELSGTYDLAAIFRGRACVFELKYNRSLREAQVQADRRQYGRSLLMELEQTKDVTCIALHVTKTGDGQVCIEGAQRPVRDVDAEWTPLNTEQR
ncbi:MAG: AAA family ATPase [Caldilineaceae bacterium SB0664_bin_22]|nr:AAA family ATPase [Caldilineaceae bacterium SB0664_bin_22]MYC61306.1 AAA family ATPase [Caldilineaceae bacterium SB0661_bin_34]